MNLTIEERNKIKTKVQDEIVEIYKSHPFLIIEMGTGCHEKDHPILMYDGSIKKVQDIKVNDLLMGDDSTPRRVLREIKGFGKMYKIIPKKGEEFIVNEDHILSLEKTGVEKSRMNLYPKILNISVKDYIKLTPHIKHLYKLYKRSVEFESNFYDEKSYYIGLWLGDGSIKSANITNIDPEIIEYLKELCKKEGCNYKCIDGIHHLISGDGKINNLCSYLRNIGIIDNKHIPLKYLSSNRKNRLELLAGLLDSDGYLDKDAPGFEIIQKNERLANEIKYLALSLGFYCSLTVVKKTCYNCKNKEPRQYFRLNIYGKVDQIPCKIKRKKRIQIINKKTTVLPNRTGFDLEEIDNNEFFGFELDKNHLYIDGNFRVHHNSGKSWATVRCIKQSKSKLPWLILVPEIAQIDNFKKEFINSGNEKLLNSVTIECYASFKNYKDKSYNIALNEVQSLSDARFDILKTINYNSIIADSATIPEDIRLKLHILRKDWYTYNLPLKESIELGIIPKPSIFAISCSLSSCKERFKYKRFGKDLNLSAEKYYETINADIKYWSDRSKKDKQPWVFNKLMSLASQRKRFISSVKTDNAKKLVSKFINEDRRFISFCGSTEQADLLGKDFSIHSKKSSKHNKNIIDEFNYFTINRLFVCGMLISGMTLSQLDTGLIIQLDKGEENDSLKFIQQVGRSLRSNNPEIYILYVKGTMDEEYLNNALKVIGKEYLVE